VIAPPAPAATARTFACDLAPYALLAFDGPDAATFLQGQLTSDVLSLSGEGCEYSSYCSPSGRVLANLLVWRAGAGDGFRALVPAESAAFVAQRLAKFVLRAKVSVSDASAACARLGVGGPGARDAVHAVLGVAPVPFALARAGRVAVLGVPGPRFVLIAPAAEHDALRTALAAYAETAEFATWEWLTLRAGVPVISEATRDKFVPQMINWDVLGGVNFQKGCYTGQEIIARTQYLGRLKERLFAFALRDGEARPGERLYSPAFGDQPCGTVVNAARIPGGGGVELLAVLQLEAAHGEVRLGKLDGLRLEPFALPYPVPAPTAPRGQRT
jgi:folate-binding protein YgfZ